MIPCTYFTVSHYLMFTTTTTTTTTNNNNNNKNNNNNMTMSWKYCFDAKMELCVKLFHQWVLRNFSVSEGNKMPGKS